MNILATQYSLGNKSLDIYLSGCKGVNGVHCKECHNPETWNFNQGDEYTKDYFDKIEQKVNDFDSLIKNIMIFGGEPLDQDINKLAELLQDLQALNKDIWLFTRQSIEEVPLAIKELCDYIKCGSYMPELKCEDNTQYGISLATSNQKIYKIN